MILPVVGGGGGSAAAGWERIYHADLTGGTAGALSSGDTVELAGATWTYNSSGAGVTLTHGSGGLVPAYVSAARWLWFTAPLADILDTLDSGDQIAILVQSTYTSATSSTGLLAGVMKMTAGSMLQASVGGFLAPGSAIVQRYNTSGGLVVGSEVKTARVGDARWGCLLAPRIGASGVIDDETDPLPTGDPTTGLQATALGTGHDYSLTYDSVGLAMYLTGALTMTITEIGVYRSGRAA